jgi:hypothetical protein
MLQRDDDEEIGEEDIHDDEDEESVESNLLKRIFDTYVKNEDYEDKKEPELEEDGVFFKV